MFSEPLRMCPQRFFFLAHPVNLSQDKGMNKLFSLFAATSCLVAPVMAAAEWNMDYAAARERALAEDKNILVFFTGSDWCGWCAILRREVLDTAEFLNFATERFVLLEIDLPKDTSRIPADTLSQNRDLMVRYNITMFPSLIAISPDGILLGGIAGGRNTREAVITPLRQAHENAAILKQADSSLGAQRAAILMSFYQNIPSAFRDNMAALREEIAALDPTDETGVHAEIRDIELASHTLTQASRLQAEDAITLLIKSLPSVSNARRQTLQVALADLLRERIYQRTLTADTLDDIEAIRLDNLLLIQHCLHPDARAGAMASLNRDFASPERLLEKLRRERAERGSDSK